LFTSISRAITLDIIGISLRLFQSIGNLTTAVNQIINSHVHLEKFYELELSKAEVNKSNFNFSRNNNSSEIVRNLEFKYFNSKSKFFENLNFKVEKNTNLDKKTNFKSPIIYVLQDKKLRELGFSSFTYSGMQMCLGSYLVLTLIQKYDFNLEKAGYFLSVAMIAGIVARPMAGIISDKISNARLVLACMGIVMSLCSGLIFFIGDLNIFFLTIFCAIFGASAVGWNGVYLSEVARIAENKMAGAATGACLSMTYLGVVVLPIIFFLSYIVFRKYEISFLFLSIITFTRAILFLKR